MAFKKLRNGLIALAVAGAVSGSVDAQTQERGTGAELEQLLLMPIQTQFQTDKEMKLKRILINPVEKPLEEEKTDWVYHGLEVSYIALNAADLALTYGALNSGAKEGNPIMKNVMHNKALTALIKTGATGFVLYAGRKIKEENSTAAYAFLTAINLIYVGVVYNNYQVNLKLDLE